ncbi:hypothetical protein [Acinetobacter pittii]|uniref:hypothetical protein n=1 Tax=Acinetobacter pittii TaxID=48296 RepID=UPI00202A97DD|nr:hypothetical protein [Acinetobacter pittii]
MAQQIVIEVPGTKISELERTSSVSRTDVTPVVQNDETKQAEIGQIADFVKSELGSAALKNESDFATPASVASASQASQARDDAQNERIDSLEYGQIATANGADRSFSTYAQMIAYMPAQDNVSVRNNDPDPELRGTYIWTGTEYIRGYDPIDLAEDMLKQFYGPDITTVNLATVTFVGAAIETSGVINLFSVGADRQFLQIDVSNAKKLIVANARNDVASWKWVFRDEHLNLIRMSNVGNFEMDVPSGAKWAMRTINAGGYVENVNLSVKLLRKTSTEIDALNQKIDGITTDFQSDATEEPIAFTQIQDIRAVNTNAASPIEIFAYNAADVRAFIQIDVSKYSKLVVANARTDISAWIWVFRDKNLRFVGVSTQYGNGTIPVPEGAKYAFRTTRVDSSSLVENANMTVIGVFRTLPVQQLLAANSEEISKLYKTLGTVNVAFPWVYGAAVSTNLSSPATVLALGAGRAYIKIDVEHFSNIVISNAITTEPEWIWVFRDSNDNLIKFTAFYGNGTLSVPNGAKWAYRTVQVDSLQLIENTAMTIIGILSSPATIQNQISEQNESIHSVRTDIDRLLIESLAMGRYVSPNQFVGETQHERIDAAVAFIKKRGWGILEFGLDIISIPNTNIWLRNSAVLIPDNCWIYLNNGSVKLQDGVFDNIFRNDGVIINSDPYLPAVELRENRNIRIFGSGVGNAFTEGPDNPYMAPHPINGGEPVQWVGDYYGWRTIGILLANVKNYKIHDFSMKKTTCWAISQEHGCDTFEIFNLGFDTQVKNGDGIDIRQGCKNGVIYNVGGHTGDDTVALSAIQNFITQHPSGSYIYPMQIGGYADRGFGGNIENIRIYDVKGSGNHNCVRLLASGGSKLKQISVDNIEDENTGYSGALVYVSSGYGSQAAMGDLVDIYVNGVESHLSNTALFVQGPVLDSQFNFIRQHNQAGVLTNTSQATFENTTVTNALMITQ